jgi:hypothetical protein
MISAKSGRVKSVIFENFVHNSRSSGPARSDCSRERADSAGVRAGNQRRWTCVIWWFEQATGRASASARVTV